MIYKGEYLWCHPDQDGFKAVGTATQCLTYPGSTKQNFQQSEKYNKFF